MRIRTLVAACAALSLLAVAAPSASARFAKFPKGINATIDTMTSQPDGKFLVGFNWDKDVGGKPYDVLAVARYTAKGKLDKSFGTNGYAFASPGTHAFEDVVQIIVQPDNKIMVGAQSSTDPGPLQVGLWRLLPNGKPDTSFGTRGDGTALVGGPLAANNAEYELHDLVRLADGSYIASGLYQESPTDWYGWLMGLSADGVSTGYTQFRPDDSLHQDAMYMATRPDGAVFVTGSADGCPGCPSSDRHWFATLDVFHSDLTHDTAWASGGPATVDLGPKGGFQRVSYQHPLVLSDGSVAVSFATTNAKVGVAVFGPDGAKRGQTIAGPLKHQIQVALLPRSGGALLVGAGDRGGNTNATGAVVAAAFDAKGQLVKRFGSKGTVVHPSAELGFWVTGVGGAAASAGGKTVVAAAGLAMTRKFEAGIGLIRLKSNGSIDPSFG